LPFYKNLSASGIASDYEKGQELHDLQNTNIKSAGLDIMALFK
jgi:hypothetical protein